MNEAACTLIDALGGTSAVARMTKTATSTVHSWRSIGITESRMDHIRLAAKEAGINMPLHHEADLEGGSPIPSPGKANCVTGSAS